MGPLGLHFGRGGAAPAAAEGSSPQQEAAGGAAGDGWGLGRIGRIGENATPEGPL